MSRSKTNKVYTTAALRRLCLKNALHWTLPAACVFAVLFALVSYSLGLLGDDGGAAISAPAVVLAPLSVVLGCITAGRLRRASVERPVPTKAAKLLRLINGHLFALIGSSTVELYMLLCMWFQKPSHITYPLLVLGGAFCLVLFLCLFDSCYYARMRAAVKWRALLWGIGYGLCYVLACKLMLQSLLLSLEEGQPMMNPWTVTCLLLCAVTGTMVRKALR